jgi:bifunctional non-homologous end joining protein LigD
MLATLVDAPFHRPGWVYEEKYDGYRILAYKEGERVTLCSRNAKDRTRTFPEVTRAVAGLRSKTLLLDGEVVGFDSHLVSRFQLLQQGTVPLVYAVFDCLYRNGRDLRAAPLPERRRALEAAIVGGECLFAARRLDADGHEAYRQAQRLGFEGLVAKDTRVPYTEGRSKHWLKVKIHKREEFVIGGYTAPAGSRTHFGALLLGAYAGRDLHFVGKVGTGFTHKSLSTLYRRFQPLVRKTPAFVNPPREKGAVWLAPELVGQVAFLEWTDDRKLRHASFLGLRDDKRPRDCLLPA